MKKAQHDRSVAEKFAAAGKAEVRAANDPLQTTTRTMWNVPGELKGECGSLKPK